MPFHQEKTPSFGVVPHKNIFHCFGCGAGSDAFKFLQLSQGLSFYEAVKELATKSVSRSRTSGSQRPSGSASSVGRPSSTSVKKHRASSTRS